MNRHVGAGADGFDGVHGGKGFGIRTAEGDFVGIYRCNVIGCL
jgi:hypothetical protein